GVVFGVGQGVFVRGGEDLARIFQTPHAEDRMVEDIDGVHPELQSALAVLAEREILLQREVEEMLSRRARAVERARRVTERPFDRAHESRRVEVRLAVLTDWAT